MTPPVLLAGAAGVIAAVGLADLVRSLVPRRRRAAGSAPGVLLLLSRVGRTLKLSLPLHRLEQRLLAAGTPFGLSTQELAAVKTGTALLFFVIGLPTYSSLPGRLPLFAAVAVPVCGSVMPDLWLERLARRRGTQVELELADVIDLLRVSLGCGMSLGRALAEVGRRRAGVLAAELASVARQIELGVPGSVALERLELRCRAAGIPQLVAAMQRTVRHGAPLGETLTAQVREARSLRAQRITEHAAKAGPKVQMIVVTTMVPAILLQVAAAVLVRVNLNF